jgi:D-glycero-D-manno-heptose 1,7-bisphosphate phosphatase
MVDARPAVFLDRDGVINAYRSNYVKRWSEVSFLPGSLAALRRLSATCCRIVVVTNQSAVGRGIMTLDEVSEINRRLVDVITAQGGRIDRIYICPHRPEAGCTCRKPRPGMLLAAAAEMNLDLGSSYLVGDARSDVEAARAAGVRGIIVLTGRGKQTAESLSPDERATWRIVQDLEGAVAYILDDHRQL